MMVRYQLLSSPDRVADNERRIAAVFDELAERRPEGLRYASYRLDDGVSFVHVAAIATADGRNPLVELPAFQRFTAGLAAHCAAPPVVTTLVAVGVFP